MFLKFLFIPLLLFVFFVSCTNDVKEKQQNIPEQSEKINEKNNDSINNTKKIETINKKEEKKENHQKIVAKYGEQWDFCKCVVANDSINTAFEGNLTDKQSDKLMIRWEHVENKCKEFLTNPNRTPEERMAHELKVKKCLKNR
jgi:hypothetical protein